MTRVSGRVEAYKLVEGLLSGSIYYDAEYQRKHIQHGKNREVGGETTSLDWRGILTGLIAGETVRDP